MAPQLQIQILSCPKGKKVKARPLKTVAKKGNQKVRSGGLRISDKPDSSALGSSLLRLVLNPKSPEDMTCSGNPFRTPQGASWNGLIPVTNRQWFPWFLRWCRISSIDSSTPQPKVLRILLFGRPTFFLGDPCCVWGTHTFFLGTHVLFGGPTFCLGNPRSFWLICGELWILQNFGRA